MRNFKNIICMLIMLAPMLVMLCHDIIPHHHHNQEHLTEAGLTVNHHQHFIHHNECGKALAHEDFHLQHSHQSEDESCCHFNQNRHQRELKYQIILVTTLYQYQELEQVNVPKFYTRNSTFISEPDQSSESLRAPPSLV